MIIFWMLSATEPQSDLDETMKGIAIQPSLDRRSQAEALALQQKAAAEARTIEAERLDQEQPTEASRSIVEKIKHAQEGSYQICNMITEILQKPNLEARFGKDYALRHPGVEGHHQYTLRLYAGFFYELDTQQQKTASDAIIEYLIYLGSMCDFFIQCSSGVGPGSTIFGTLDARQQIKVRNEITSYLQKPSAVTCKTNLLYRLAFSVLDAQQQREVRDALAVRLKDPSFDPDSVSLYQNIFDKLDAQEKMEANAIMMQHLDKASVDLSYIKEIYDAIFDNLDAEQQTKATNIALQRMAIKPKVQKVKEMGKLIVKHDPKRLPEVILAVLSSIVAIPDQRVNPEWIQRYINDQMDKKEAISLIKVLQDSHELAQFMISAEAAPQNAWREVRNLRQLFIDLKQASDLGEQGLIANALVQGQPQHGAIAHIKKLPLDVVKHVLEYSHGPRQAEIAYPDIYKERYLTERAAYASVPRLILPVNI